jgi:hypothetical protein
LIEVWKSIEGFSNYQISSEGRIRRCTCGNRTRVGFTLKGGLHRDGYHQVTLRKDDAKGQAGFQTHKLVALAFLGIRPIGHDINHKDGNKLNNRLDNLEYVTRSYNLKHAIRLGLRASFYKPGDAHILSKLTLEKAAAIRKLSREKGFSRITLANLFKVGTSTIGRVLRNELWVQKDIY